MRMYKTLECTRKMLCKRMRLNIKMLLFILLFAAIFSQHIIY